MTCIGVLFEFFFNLLKTGTRKDHVIKITRIILSKCTETLDKLNTLSTTIKPLGIEANLLVRISILLHVLPLLLSAFNLHTEDLQFCSEILPILVQLYQHFNIKFADVDTVSIYPLHIKYSLYWTIQRVFFSLSIEKFIFHRLHMF